jgi:PAS domain S-box-containing protein
MSIMKKNILVVDDNPIMLKFMMNVLNREGHHVKTAEDGFVALSMLTSFKPDIMFIDLIMPRLDGRKLCQIVRKMEDLKNCYVVVISAAVLELNLDCIEIGANACIAKGPFDVLKKNVLAAIKESYHAPRDTIPKSIMGLETIDPRRMTSELLSRNRHLETMLESMAEGILEIFSNRIVYANSAAVSLFGLPEEKLLFSYPFDLFDKYEQARIEALLKAGEGGPFEIGHDTPLKLRDRQVTIRYLPVKGDGSTVIILITDVTERKLLELQVQHARKMEAIGTIASGVAHNFRNVLNAIHVNNQLIQMNLENNPEVDENTGRIESAVKKGAQLVEDLMRFSRKELIKEFKSFNLSELIRETHQRIKISFDKNIDIQINVPESISMIGMPSELAQALTNLYTNAREAMPNGGVLRIEAKVDENKVIVMIADTGQGMDKEVKDKCFDPFFTTKGIGKGTGLGLSTTYGIIKDHEGDIHVYSEPNEGTVFELFLPLAP